MRASRPLSSGTRFNVDETLNRGGEAGPTRSRKTLEACPEKQHAVFFVQVKSNVAMGSSPPAPAKGGNLIATRDATMRENAAKGSSPPAPAKGGNHAAENECDSVGSACDVPGASITASSALARGLATARQRCLSRAMFG